MNTSRMAVFYEAGKSIELKNETIPALKPGQILVKNEYTTLCRSDLNTFSGKRTEKTPTILGHEIVGRIAAFATDAPLEDERGNTLHIGDRITWAIYASNPESEMSKRGIPQKGEGLFKYGHERITDESTLHGGLADYTIIQAHTPIVKIHPEIPVEVVAFINCAVATVAGSIRLAGDLKGKNVAVFGTGMLGIIACAMSKHFGAEHVLAVDVSDKRLKNTLKFGADQTINSQNGLENATAELYGKKRPIDIVLEYSGAAVAMEDSLHIMNIGATAVWVGATFPHPPLNIGAEQIIRNLHTIKGLHNYTNIDLLQAVEFIEETYKIYPYTELVSKSFPLEQVNEAFSYAIEKNPFRAGVKID